MSKPIGQGFSSLPQQILHSNPIVEDTSHQTSEGYRAIYRDPRRSSAYQPHITLDNGHKFGIASYF
jgi:hypothetical protein